MLLQWNGRTTVNWAGHTLQPSAPPTTPTVLLKGRFKREVKQDLNFCKNCTGCEANLAVIIDFYT
jgi:hypothetical protein